MDYIERASVTSLEIVYVAPLFVVIEAVTEHSDNELKNRTVNTVNSVFLTKLLIFYK